MVLMKKYVKKSQKSLCFYFPSPRIDRTPPNYTPNTVRASIFSLWLIFRAIFNVGSLLPVI